MYYRVMMDLAFKIEDEATDFFHDGVIALPKSRTINPGTDEEERGHILLQKCYHDEGISRPCETLQEAFGPD